MYNTLMLNDQRGFEHILVAVLLVLLIAIAGAGAVFALKHAQKQPKNNSGTATNNQSKNSPATATKCKDDPKITFSHDFSEADNIQVINPPVISNTNVRDRAWVALNWDKVHQVNVYAPTDADIISGVYKVEQIGKTNTDYDLWFQMSCTRWFFINHISNPIAQIRALLPSQPVSQATNGTSATASMAQFSHPLHVTAGQLLGYTTGTSGAHNFDLGVFDNNVHNTLPASYTKGDTSDRREMHAICGFDWFPAVIKAKYYAVLAASPHETGSLCPQ
jgi:hypothetical protein